ncbi:MAG: DUF2851 family protein [Saprospiraceae bacterium]|nr:DUF2851 family protein [Saprospiraceae bacterium]
MSPVLLQSITSEQLLHYIWKTKQFDRTRLRLTDDTPLDICDFGRYNTNSGPDFQHGKIRIGDTIMAGHIEMHIFSSEWETHGHQSDPAYNNVVLHVVAMHDKEVCTQNGTRIPTLVLTEYLDEDIVMRYGMMSAERENIPCARLHPGKVSSDIWNIWKERLNVERLQDRLEWINQELEAAVQDWEAIFFKQMLISMGTNVNKEAFKALARHLDYSVFMRLKSDEVALHAYVLGTSGLLSRGNDAYLTRLRDEYQFICMKYPITAVNPVIWKYARMHPSNFPDIRIAQLTEMFRCKEHFFAKAIDCTTIRQLKDLLKVDDLPVYWQYHYKVGNRSKPCKKTLGNHMKTLIIINAILPLMFLYGRNQNKTELQERALQLLQQVAPEDNYIVRMWQELGVKSESALDTQALIQLKNQYCDQKRCLECSIGHQLLKKKI